jgi:hypothetical protein
MINRIKFFFLMVLVGFISACAGPLIEEHAAALDRTSICCNAFFEFQATQLNLNTDFREDVSLKSPAYEFAQGKSFFRTYQLPQSKSTGQKLIIRTFPINTLMINSAHVFIPRVTTLDVNHKPIRSTALKLAFHRPAIIGESWWYGELMLNPSESFVIVHTGVEERAALLRMPDSDVGAIYVPVPGGGGVLMPNARGGYRFLQGGPTGEISVSVVEG